MTAILWLHADFPQALMSDLEKCAVCMTLLEYRERPLAYEAPAMFSPKRVGFDGTVLVPKTLDSSPEAGRDTAG